MSEGPDTDSVYAAGQLRLPMANYSGGHTLGLYGPLSRLPPRGEQFLDGERGVVIGGCDLDHGQSWLCHMCFVDRLHA